MIGYFPRKAISTETLRLTSIDCSIPLRDIYARVNFSEQDTGEA